MNKTLLSLLVVTSSVAAGAATVATLGPGSAVSSADLVATFDTLTATNTMELGAYKEGGLSVTTGSQSWGADLPAVGLPDPFHLPGGGTLAYFGTANGSTDWVVIQTTNRALMHGVEFLYGNTWTTGNSAVPWGRDDAFVPWQTLSNGVLVSSGQLGPNPMLPVGTVVGFFDPGGFDQLLVKCGISNSSPPNAQALALDNLLVQLTSRPPAPVIWPSDFSLDPATGVPTLLVYGTLTNCQYRLVYTESLTNGPAAWSATAGGWQFGTDVLTLTDPGAVGRPHRFYRVEAR
jgi:hypothetical protein